MLEFFAILAVALTGGALPLLWKWGHRQFHAALALSSGVFLGAVFLHLLPMVGAFAGTGHAALVFGPSLSGDALGLPGLHDHDGDGVPDHLASDHRATDPRAADVLGSDLAGARTALDAPAPESAPGAAPRGSQRDPMQGDPPTTRAEPEAPKEPAPHDHGSTTAWLWVLLGVVGVYFVEALLVPDHHHHPHQAGCGPERRENLRHRAVGWAALVGLSVHSLTSGVALAAVAEDRAIADVMLWAILAHKGFESFSLASVFSMTARGPRQVLALVVAFSFVTPLGLLLGHQVTALFGTGGIAVLTALAAGTFLYVCIGELLPEVFHHREDVFLKIALLCAGVAGMYAVHTIGGV